MPDDAQLYELATRVGRRLLASKRRMVTAESCTGGWIAKAMTDVPGSSQLVRVRLRHLFQCGKNARSRRVASRRWMRTVP